MNKLLLDLHTHTLASGHAYGTIRENAQLRGELDAFRGQKAEIGDMLLTARSLARSIIENANAQADEIVARARTQADAILRAGAGTESAAVMFPMVISASEVRKCREIKPVVKKILTKNTRY